MNESIGSYVLRLCAENSCEVNQISDLIGLKLRGIGHYYRKLKEENIAKFSELTGIDIKVIDDMTTNRFSLNMYSDFSCRAEACVCPKCYSERSYERIHWKNNLIKVCVDHEIYLVDECPHCKEKITSNILLNGKCNCGLLISDFKYAKCVNEYLLENQKILYKIFDIKSRASLKECDLLYNALSGRDYCDLLCHLQNLAKQYVEGLNDLDILIDNDEGFKSNIIASWIILDWPANIISFLNYLNQLDIKYINRSFFEVDYEFRRYTVIDERFMRIFNPLKCLKLEHISNIFFRYKEIYQSLMIYYFENINKENVKMKMDRYIYLNDYVELDIAIKIFFDIENSDNDIKQFVINYFHVYKFFDNEYLDLEEIFIFYDKIKRNSSSSFSDIEEISHYNTCTSFLVIFKYFNITLSDIFHMQVDSKFKVRFNPIHFGGLRSVYFQINQMKKELLLLCADRIHVTD
jgi:hypothetical protein